MSRYLVADYSNFNKYGGVEKNAELIIKIERLIKLKIKRAKYKYELFLLLFK